MTGFVALQFQACNNSKLMHAGLVATGVCCELRGFREEGGNGSVRKAIPTNKGHWGVTWYASKCSFNQDLAVVR